MNLRNHDFTASFTAAFAGPRHGASKVRRSPQVRAFRALAMSSGLSRPLGAWLVCLGLVGCAGEPSDDFDPGRAETALGGLSETGGGSAAEGGDGASETGSTTGGAETAGDTVGDGDGDGDGDASTEPFERFVASIVSEAGATVHLLPGPPLQAAMPAVDHVAIFIPREPYADAGQALTVAAVDAAGTSIFRASVTGPVDLYGEGRPGILTRFADHRIKPKPPTNCTVPPCPNDVPTHGYVLAFEAGDIRWVEGQVDGAGFGYGVDLAAGEVVPSETAQRLDDARLEKLRLTELLLEDAGEFMRAPVEQLPAEVVELASFCPFGKFLLKGTLTAGQAACCVDVFLFPGACLICAAVGEAGKDGVDEIDCD